jgi:ABC-2 type transport system ATP-binding protein
VTAVPLRFTEVDKALAGRPVLRAVSFACRPGRITALLGPNGAGKTTAVTLATGLRRPDAGRVAVFGREPVDAAARRQFALVPQELGFPDAVTAGSCLRLVTGQRPDRGLAPPVPDLCERMGLGGLLDRRVGGLSGGQRRRLAVVLGLAAAPGLVVLDEATTNLDESSRRETWRLVREYTARGGSALVTSHILADIETHADDVVALAAGRVVLASPLAAVRDRLGADTVSVRVPAGARAAVRAAVADRALGREVPAAAPEACAWRTRRPVALVAAIAAQTDAAEALLVRPTPLAELLAELGAAPAEEEQPCGEYC